MHLVIAIPTYNRCNYLKKNIQYFDQQIRPKKVRISLAISNSASVDDTEKYLEELKSKRKDVFTFNEQTGWNGGNYGGCT